MIIIMATCMRTPSHNCQTYEYTGYLHCMSIAFYLTKMLRHLTITKYRSFTYEDAFVVMIVLDCRCAILSIHMQHFIGCWGH